MRTVSRSMRGVHLRSVDTIKNPQEQAQAVPTAEWEAEVCNTLAVSSSPMV
jgi:hypothetical protein